MVSAVLSLPRAPPSPLRVLRGRHPECGVPNGLTEIQGDRESPLDTVGLIVSDERSPYTLLLATTMGGGHPPLSLH